MDDRHIAYTWLIAIVLCLAGMRRLLRLATVAPTATIHEAAQAGKVRFFWGALLLVGQLAMASDLPLIEEVDLPKYWVEQSGSGALSPGDQRRHAEARRLIRLHGSVYVSMEYTIDQNGRVSNVTPTAIEPAELNPALFTVMQKYTQFKAAPGVAPTAVRVRVTRRRNWIPDLAN